MDTLRPVSSENPQFVRENALAQLVVAELEHAVNKEHEAMTDSLTGLNNREALEHVYDKLVMPTPGNRKSDSKIEILSEPNSFLFIDMDNLSRSMTVRAMNLATEYCVKQPRFSRTGHARNQTCHYD